MLYAPLQTTHFSFRLDLFYSQTVSLKQTICLRVRGSCAATAVARASLRLNHVFLSLGCLRSGSDVVSKSSGFPSVRGRRASVAVEGQLVEVLRKFYGNSKQKGHPAAENNQQRFITQVHRLIATTITFPITEQSILRECVWR